MCLVVISFVIFSSECNAQSVILREDDNPRDTISGPFVTYDWKFRFDYIIPNPLNQAGGVFTQFELPQSCSVSVSILDSTQNIIYDYGTLELAQGSYTIIWSYENNDGEKVPQGYYYFDLYARSIGTESTGIDFIDDFARIDLVNEYRCRHSFHAFPSDVTFPSKDK